VDLGRLLIRKQKYRIKRICRALGIARSNQYANPEPRPKRYKRQDDKSVLKSILEVTKSRATYGYQRVTALINRDRKKALQMPWNEKRIYRVMKMNSLLLEQFTVKPKRLHLGQVITMKSNMRYCSDMLEIRCWSGEKIFVAFSLDCCDREVMSWVAEKRPLFHGDVIRLIDQTVTHRFGEFVEKLPSAIQWLTDQGPQYKAEPTVRYATEWGFDVRTTPAYSPESNGIAEAFVKLFKRDYVYTSELWTAESVLRQLPGWFKDYNQNHPHSGLQMKSPLEYRESVNSTEKVSV
jgi:transposase InsO family protein